MQLWVSILLSIVAVEGGLSLLPAVRFWRQCRRRSVRFHEPPPLPPWGTWARPRVALLVPCKGQELGLAEHLRALATQNYPDYTAWFITATADDPAVPTILEIEAAHPNTAHWHLSGLHEGCGEKAASLRAAVRAVGEVDVIATADSDGRPDPGWLSRLVGGLPSPQGAPAAATGYRWYLPAGGGLGSWLQAVWNASALFLLASPRPPFVWGGATAIWRHHLLATDVLERWAQTVSDDYSLTRALRAAGGSIHFVPEALVPNRARLGTVETLRWVGRQLLLTRIYAPRLWWTVSCYQAVWTFAVGAGLATVHRGTAVAWLVGLVLTASMIKGGLRWSAVRHLLPGKGRAHDRSAWAFILLAPLVAPLTLVGALLSALTRRIRWRGTTYYLAGPERTLVLDRAAGTETPTVAPPSADSGVPGQHSVEP